jgi:hypothetical protein
VDRFIPSGANGHSHSANDVLSIGGVRLIIVKKHWGHIAPSVNLKFCKGNSLNASRASWLPHAVEDLRYAISEYTPFQSATSFLTMSQQGILGLETLNSVVVPVLTTYSVGVYVR